LIDPEHNRLSRGVVVLGVHRSGTSLLTASLQALGCSLGDFPHVANEGNPKGYFEHPDIMAFNDRLFESLGASWDSWGFFAGGIDFSSHEFAQARLEANALLHKCFSGLGVWAVKDPRMTHLLPFWEATFAEYHIEVRRVLIVRAPMEVIQSQLQRYKANPSFFYTLTDKSAIAAWWVVIMLGVVKTLKDGETFLVNHADLYDKTVDTLQACARFLDMPTDSDALTRFADEFVEPDLRRSRPVELYVAGAWESAAQRIFTSLVAQPTPRRFSSRDAQAIWNTEAELRTLLPYFAPVVSSHHMFRSALAQNPSISGREQTVTAYVSELVDGVPLPYSAKRKGVCRYLLDGKRVQVSVSLPDDLGRLAALRMDVSDRIAVVELHALHIVSGKGEELWRWDGRSAVFERLTRMICLEGQQGVTFVCHQNDPQMVLKLPPQVLGRMDGKSSLHFDMTPFPLQERLTSVLTALQKAAQPTSGGAKSGLAPIPPVASQLAEVADSLRQWLSVRDEQVARDSLRLAQQEAEHAQLRRDLIRAQAQLELLKEVMQSRGNANTTAAVTAPAPMVPAPRTRRTKRT